MRFATPNPALIADPPSLKILSRALHNTLEQSLIFLFLLANWILSQSEEKNKHEAVLLTAAFIVGRTLFVIGYAIGAQIGIPSLRILGFSLTIGTNMLLALRAVGMPLV